MRFLNRFSFVATMLLFAIELASLPKAVAQSPQISSDASAVATAEYKFPATIDPMVLEGRATELWARAFWPKNLSKPHPILFLLHGNHETCRANGTVRDDMLFKKQRFDS